MKKTLLTLALILSVSTVAGLTDSQLQSFKAEYNNQTDKVPSFLGDIVGGEKLNLHLEKENKSDIYGAEMEGVRIEELKKGGFEDPTMNVYADENAVETVIDSSKPYQKIEQKLDEKEIKYNSTTTGGKVKLTVFETLRDLARLFGLDF